MDDRTGTNLALQWPSSERRMPSAETKRLIAMLGLRYPPSTKQDEAGRAGQLALLTDDVADIPPTMLDMAIRQWVKTKGFMPKASELFTLAHEFSERERLGQGEVRKGETTWDRANRALDAVNDPERLARWRDGILVDPPREKRTDRLSKDEIEKLISGNSISQGVFQMGVNAGWLVMDTDGRWREIYDYEFAVKVNQ